MSLQPLSSTKPLVADLSMHTSHGVLHHVPDAVLWQTQRMKRIGQVWKGMAVEERLKIILDHKEKMAAMGVKDRALVSTPFEPPRLTIRACIPHIKPCLPCLI